MVAILKWDRHLTDNNIGHLYGKGSDQKVAGMRTREEGRGGLLVVGWWAAGR